MAYDEKAVVKINSDGELMQCAKGLGNSECGYKPGSKVCGKCGAMAASIKEMPMDDDDEMMDDEEDMAPKKKGNMRRTARWSMKEDDEMMDDEEESVDEEDDEEDEMPLKGYGKRRNMKMKADDEDEMSDEDMVDDEDDEDDEDEMPAKGYGKRRKMKMKAEDEDDMDDEDMSDDDEEEDDEEEDDDEEMMGAKSLEHFRRQRLSELNVKSLDLAESGFLCGIDRKVYPGGSVCDDCPGGCMSEKGLPGLLEIEGMVQHEFKGDVIDSGYSDDADMFVIDLATKGDKMIEVFVDGTTAEVLGFHRLEDSTYGQKSLDDELARFIDFNEAADIAVKSVPGDVTAVEPDVFEGFDCYAVVIEGVDGKSYDVFVSLDGYELGREWYTTDEAEEIEAEAAEIALKRAFTDDQREKMAEKGEALPDGSFPIANKDDLQNAIQAYGRAKDKIAAKAHIMKRARALGAESMIPESWTDEKTLDGGFLQSLAEFELLAEDEDFMN